MEWLGEYLGLTEMKHGNLYSSVNKIRVIKYRAMKRMGHIRRIMDRSISQSKWVERKRPRDRPRREWKVILR